MQITTYKNASEEHVLDKQLTVVNSGVNAMFKDDTNMINPTIIISSLMSKNFNYVYISDTDRYYYVNDMTYSQQRTFINLSVDVLMSFNSDIKDLEVIANRSSSYYNTYQKDDSIPFENRNIISTQPFSAGFGGECLILAVNGGGAPVAPTTPGGDE